jgi:hypothetical protein
MKLRAKEFYPGKDGALKAQVQVLDQDEDPVTVLFEDTITLTSAKKVVRPSLRRSSNGVGST